MTTPTERTRALRHVGEFLKQLKRREDVPADLRMQAERLQRHYPEDWMIEMMAEEWQKSCQTTFGLAPEQECYSGSSKVA